MSRSQTSGRGEVFAPRVQVIGAGLAGSQAALTIASLGGRVLVSEMRPCRQTPAHRTGLAAELVCSNSLRSDQPYSAPWLLKEELRRLRCELLRIAGETAVPGGSSLTVDRDAFSRAVTRALETNPRIEIRREEVDSVPLDDICVIATGPLTADAFAESLRQVTGSDSLLFSDAVNPIVDAATIDHSRVFAASRYGKGGPDYLNCPMSREQYLAFHAALVSADTYAGHAFDSLNALGCPPLELLAKRGVDTLRFGPMKPVGLVDPRTGREPYAVVQLRGENLRHDSYNMVGFQNRLTFEEQKRVFRLIPGLEQVEFIRYGQAHRNTYLCAPRLLTPALHLRTHPRLFFAGQLSGVEGYVESIATGAVAGLNAWRRTVGLPMLELPATSGLGALCHYLAGADAEQFAPVRLTFDLLPRIAPAGARLPRQSQREQQCRAAVAALDAALSAATEMPVGAGAQGVGTPASSAG